MGIIDNLRQPLDVPGKMIDWFIRDMHSTYGLALARIIVGLYTVLFCLFEWKNRLFFFGPGSNWAAPYKAESIWTAPWFGFFNDQETTASFTIKWCIMGLFGLFVLVGFCTRFSSLCLFLVMTSLIAQGPSTSDSGDIVVRIMLLLFVLADTSQRLSVDRRIAEKRGTMIDYGGLTPMRRGLMPMSIRVPLHNMALVLICAQVTFVYFFAGIAKLSGPLWRNGTATYYPFHADYLTPWPELSHLMGQNTLLTMLMTYGSVAVQLLFPFMLLTRPTRVFIVIAMIALHAGIGVFLGLGLFSLAMCGADLAFIRDQSFIKYSAKARKLFEQLRGKGDEDDAHSRTSAGSTVTGNPASTQAS